MTDYRQLSLRHSGQQHGQIMFGFYVVVQIKETLDGRPRRGFSESRCCCRKNELSYPFKKNGLSFTDMLSLVASISCQFAFWSSMLICCRLSYRNLKHAWTWRFKKIITNSQAERPTIGGEMRLLPARRKELWLGLFQQRGVGERKGESVYIQVEKLIY